MTEMGAWAGKTDIAYRRGLTCFCHTRGAGRHGCCVVQHRDHNARRRTVMIIKSATRLAFAAGCLAVITTLSAAHAQMGYWPPQNPYGPPTGPYGYGPPPGAYGAPTGAYGPAPGTYAQQSQYVPPAAGTQVITNGPQTNPGDVSPSWSPQRNVVESEQYDRLLKGNPAFRQARMRKECGPITDRQLHQQCLDSFAPY